MDNESFFIILESDIILNKNITSTEKILYATICFYSNNKTGYCFKSYRSLMQIMNLKERQFYNCLEDLKNFGLITTEKKANHAYLMPVCNKVYLLAKEKREKKQQELKERYADVLDYNWLEEKNEKRNEY